MRYFKGEGKEEGKEQPVSPLARDLFPLSLPHMPIAYAPIQHHPGYPHSPTVPHEPFKPYHTPSINPWLVLDEPSPTTSDNDVKCAVNDTEYTTNRKQHISAVEGFRLEGKRKASVTTSNGFIVSFFILFNC